MDKKQFREFVDGIYSSSKYELKNIKLSAQQVSESLIVKASSGGSSGGSCWGSSTSSYSKDESEIVEELACDINSAFYDIRQKAEIPYEVFKEVSEELAQKAYDSYNYESYTDSHDYYGNYTEYRAYVVKIKDILDSFVEKGIVKEDRKEQFERVLQDASSAYEKTLVEEENRKKLEDIKKKIVDFENDKSKEHETLQQNLKRARETVTTLEKKIDNFAKNKHLERLRLENEKNNLEKVLGIDEQVSNSKSTKKMKP